MREQDLCGMTFVPLYRRSKSKQTYSIERQRDVCRPMVEMYKLKLAAELVLDDHSATCGEQWAALYEVVERKRRGEKIDGIFCSDYSRIGRTMDEVERYYLDCADAGLLLLTQKEGLLSGKDAWIRRNAAAAANERFGENLAVNTTTGIMGLMKAGILPHTLLVPFGLDRLVTTLGHPRKPLYRLRLNSDGVLRKLSADFPHDVLETYEGETRNDFPRRQKTEAITFAPGDDILLEVVRRAFQYYFIGDEFGMRLSFLQIARRFDREGLPSPRGTQWASPMVKNIILNPVYTGIGICNRRATGVHATRDKTTPKLFGTPRRPERAPNGKKRKGVKTIVRSSTDWFVVRYKNLMSILPPRTRRLARSRNRTERITPEKLARRAVWTQKRFLKGDSRYFLTGLIYTEQGGLRMHGMTATNRLGEKTYVYRKYFITHERRPEVMNDRRYKKSLDAIDLEGRFLELLADLAKRDLGFRDRVRQAAQAKLARETKNESSLDALVQAKQEFEDHLGLILRLGPKGRKLAANEADSLAAKIDEIEQQIADARSRRWTFMTGDVESVVDGVVKQFKKLPAVLDGADHHLLRKLAIHIVERIIFDGLTNEVTFHLCVPARLLTPDATWADVLQGDDFSLKREIGSSQIASPLRFGSYKFREFADSHGKWTLKPLPDENLPLAA